MFVILVVVVLFIVIALSVITILGIINDGRSDAAESSTYAYIEAVESTTINYLMKNTNSYGMNDISGTCSVNGSKLNCNKIPDTLEVDIKGEVPTSGEIIISEYGEVDEIKNLVIGEYTCNYENDKVTCE